MRAEGVCLRYLIEGVEFQIRTFGFRVKALKTFQVSGKSPQNLSDNSPQFVLRCSLFAGGI